MSEGAIGDEELRALLADATPGPWLIEDDDPEAWRVYIERPKWIRYVAVCSDPDGDGRPEVWEADARLIALAPSLAAEVIELRSLLAELRRERDELRGALGELEVDAGQWRSALEVIDRKYRGEFSWHIAHAQMTHTEHALERAQAALRTYDTPRPSNPRRDAMGEYLRTAWSAKDVSAEIGAPRSRHLRVTASGMGGRRTKGRIIFDWVGGKNGYLWIGDDEGFVGSLRGVALKRLRELLIEGLNGRQPKEAPDAE